MFTEAVLLCSFSFQVLVEKMELPEKYASSSAPGDPRRMLAGLLFPIILLYLGDNLYFVLSFLCCFTMLHKAVVKCGTKWCKELLHSSLTVIGSLWELLSIPAQETSHC